MPKTFFPGHLPDPAYSKPSRLRAPKNTLPAPVVVAETPQDDDPDFVPRPPQKHAPAWNLRNSIIGLNRDDGGFGRVADLHLVAKADRDNRLDLPDFFPELFGSIPAAVRAALESTPAVKHLRKLQRVLSVSVQNLVTTCSPV
ncbi:MAG TPA: hypothetical protein VMF69_25235 [Gemmataceae bacterium]|nr:hypothetical protein [Gemmataceae bacterium]